MLAVIEASGRQYLVKKGQKIILNKVNDEQLIFDKVLLFFDGQKLFIGKPFLDNVKVLGKVVKKFKKKIQIIKFKAKTRYKKKVGYKNYFSEVIIKDFVFS